MNTFKEVLLLPGAAPILSDKLSGRLIGRIADGFDKDPALKDMMNLFCALEATWPGQILSLREMYDLQLKSASKDSSAGQKARDKLTPEQLKIWLGEQTRTESPEDKLQNALPKIVDLYTAATANMESWEDLTPINQWSLLNSTERGLHDRLARYRKWAYEDEEKGRTESNAIRLRDDALDAVQPLTDAVTEFLNDPTISMALEQDAVAGIRVPARRLLD